MSQHYNEDFIKTFRTPEDMERFHEDLDANTEWRRVPIPQLNVSPLDSASPLLDTPEAFADGISVEAIEDTADNLALAVQIEGEYFPLALSAAPGLNERAKIHGSVLSKLRRSTLANTLNECLRVHKKSKALVLVRNEKVFAVHSGDESDYAIMPISDLLAVMTKKLDERFPGNRFMGGYSSHTMTRATWELSWQKDELLGAYIDRLKEIDKTILARDLMPAIRFSTSDTGDSSVKASAVLLGLSAPLPIGDVVAVEHRHGKTIRHFEDALDEIFAQYIKSMERMEILTHITLRYPVNALVEMCRKLKLPKKASAEAIQKFEFETDGLPATVHDAFLSMQEIIFNLQNAGAKSSAVLRAEEMIARALYMDWSEYDLPVAM